MQISTNNIFEKAARYECLNLCAKLPVFTFTGDVGGSIQHGEQLVIGNLLPGEYTTTETPSGDWFIEGITVDDDGPNDPAPCDHTIGDPNENGTPEHPFDTIQEAIDVAKEGATVLVREGYYRENIDFLGKRIVVTSFTPNGSASPLSYPIIAGTAEPGGGHVVTFNQVHDPNVGLSGFVITGGYGHYAGALLCSQSSPTILNCLIVGNRAASLQGGGGAVYCMESTPLFVNCTWRGITWAKAISMWVLNLSFLVSGNIL